MKKLILATLLCMVIPNTIFGQKYITREATIHFNGDTPLETIDATSNQASAILNTATKKMAFQVLMNSFQFEKALMQEHFNENYVESEKFPNGTFIGTLESETDFKSQGVFSGTLSGTLTVHGVEKQISVPVEIKITDMNITLSGDFTVSPKDFEIKIPGLVEDKIAKEIKVDFKATFKS